MNRSKLKVYAPKARRDFIQAMKDRALYYGLSGDKIEVTKTGDVAIIGGKAFPRAVLPKRKRLEERIKRQGFDQVMEAMAYTWFNRFVAIRFMELHGYLDHGYRVLSPTPHRPEATIPEILEHAEHVDLPGLDRNKVIELKLDGTKEAELYRMLLVAQCNALHSAMPFLFERIDDETELLLPDNLLHSDSLIRQLVNEIDEADWQEIEIIGWLYEAYIAEKYGEVIGKVVASEDIPAATQRFTPKWIVKYLVQNSLGRKWLATYPHSPLRQKMEFYIEPAEQTLDVQAQLKAITPESLNPEELTLLDPACGSGHILVEAYDIFKEIYQERGYRAKDIPRLILEKNLFGLEIDDRAAQLAAFALLMKARADDRRIFASTAKPNILAFVKSAGMDAEDIIHALNSPIKNEETPSSEYLFEEIEDHDKPLFSRKAVGIKWQIAEADVAALLEVFEHAKTFGSLIQIPPKLAAKLPEIEQRLNDVLRHGDLTHAPAYVITPLLEQARLLSRQYDAVVANPPYMGNGYFVPSLREYINTAYKPAKEDLYACFIMRNCEFTAQSSFFGMITIPNWMFLSSYEALRDLLLRNRMVASLIHNGRGVWGSDFGSCSFVIQNCPLTRYEGAYKRLFEHKGSIATNDELQTRYFSNPTFHVSGQCFLEVPGKPLAYWVGENVLRHFSGDTKIKDIGEARRGLQTGNSPRFIRFWHEVDSQNTLMHEATREASLCSGAKWVLFNNGGDFRKWFGNVEHVVNWERNGEEIKQSGKAIIPNEHHYFKEAISWSRVSAGKTAFRFVRSGILPGDSGPCIFTDMDKLPLLAYLNSVVARTFLEILVPTLTFLTGDVESLPVMALPADGVGDIVRRNAEECIGMSRADWNARETSWGFERCPLLQNGDDDVLLANSWQRWNIHQGHAFAAMREKEEQNNQLLSRTYGLDGVVSSAVQMEEITLHSASQGEDIKRLLSYGIGCMMGRYSLDKPGLIYAHSGNQEFDPGQYKTFPADDDGIIPLTDTAWFDDDATNRVIEFIGVAWPKEHLEDNLKFVAESLGPNKGEQPRDTIRRYLAQEFFKDHLKAYKKRPIYWLFSSGKQRAFQCLVYLHRYNEGTLSRMRTEYVIPLQGKIAARIEQLVGDIAAATSASHRSKLTKEREKLLKQQAELRTFDERLRHYADMQISLDLDDGVKVNYGKFGDLLAEVKAVTGGSSDE